MSTSPLPALRVATLNIFGHHGGWPDRRPVLIDGFGELRPDVIALQEVIRTDAHDQAAEILGGDYHIAHQTRRRVDDNGIAIASRWPIQRLHEIDLDVTPRTARFFASALVAEIHVPGPIGPILFVNHLPEYQPAYEYERELQTVLVARRIEEIVHEREMPVILAGDLDADGEAASIRFLSGRQSLQGMSVCYRNVWESAHPGEPGDTFTPENGLMTAWDWPFGRIDHIFVRFAEGGGPSLAITSCVRIFDQPAGGVWASDHFGLLAELAPPKRRR